ncbi:cyclin N-terminal domain-containing protein 1 isoform X2 [Brachyhypopomus gauderio]|uniref:cyclin N-terminal domain-containing protein 1 isoform X2 n=1 Tax=Brachyhypopomus gauderio TaxID=698409 RepID=UPI0040413E4D
MYQAFVGVLRTKESWTFLICEEQGLDPLVGYHAIEILERFMVKHIENVFSSQISEVREGSSCGTSEKYEDLLFQRLSEKFYIFILSSVQIASKLALHSSAIDYNSASRYLQSVGSSCHREKLLESELLILKTLDFKLIVPNPLSYVETLLEVICHNDPTIPVAHIHHLCKHVLQFIYLQRDAIYHSLLKVATGCFSLSSEQRAQFVSVTEDCMLLGVGVITVAAFIYQTSAWKKVVEELTSITGISEKSIMDFAWVTLMHITEIKSP